MATVFPAQLPAIPDGAWGIAERPPHARHFLIDAPNAATAEARVLAWLDHQRDTPMYGARAIAAPGRSRSRWQVSVLLPDPEPAQAARP